MDLGRNCISYLKKMVPNTLDKTIKGIQEC